MSTHLDSNPQQGEASVDQEADEEGEGKNEARDRQGGFPAALLQHHLELGNTGQKQGQHNGGDDDLIVTQVSLLLQVKQSGGSIIPAEELRERSPESPNQTSPSAAQSR